jgi:hypothetical protein
VVLLVTVARIFINCFTLVPRYCSVSSRCAGSHGRLGFNYIDSPLLLKNIKMGGSFLLGPAFVCTVCIAVVLTYLCRVLEFLK